MTIWLLPGNTKFYNHLNAFKELKVLDWTQRNKYNVNDIVFIYTTKPYQKIMVKAIVEQINLPFSQYIDDSKYWMIPPKIEEQQRHKYVRLRLLQFCNSNELSLINLQKNNFLIKAPQSPQKVNEEFYNFIDKIFEEENLISENSNKTDSIYTEEQYEGELKEREYLTRTRNRHIVETVKQRDNYTCLGCGFTYKQKIVQVHHLTPISEKGNGIISINELVTLCPTCHAIAHLLLKQNNKYRNKTLLIKEIKNIMQKNKNRT